MCLLRQKLKEKSGLLRSLVIINNNQRNKTSDETPKNPTPTFPSKNNNSDTKEHAPAIKDGIINFCINDTTSKSDTIEKNEVVSRIKKISLNKKNIGRKQRGKRRAQYCN